MQKLIENGTVLGKSFLLRPLPLVYGEEGVFVTPPKSAFPLLGFEKARLVWLDDWRFNEDLVSWALQLLWFEGASKQDPIFVTTLQADLHALKGILKQGDVDMMLKRLHVFEFQHKVNIPAHVAKGCGACFASFVLGGGQPAPMHEDRAKREAEVATEMPEAKRLHCLSWTVDDVCAYVTDLELAHVVPLGC